MDQTEEAAAHTLARTKRKKTSDKEKPPAPAAMPALVPKKWNPPPNSKQFHFMPSMTQERIVTVMQSLVQRHSVKLDMSQVLPHVRLPIGSDGSASLFAMVDSGAGLNLGRLQYHLDIATKAPHLVAYFGYLRDEHLKDSSNQDEFTLGQVGEGDGPKVTAVIVYYTNFICDANNVTIAFGLTDSCTTNTIIGFPFLKAADGISMFGSNALVLQRFGVTLNMDYSVPLLANQAAQVTQDCQVFNTDPKIAKTVEKLKAGVSAAFASRNDKRVPGAFGSDEFDAYIRSEDESESEAETESS
jgi:hypothetical protein